MGGRRPRVRRDGLTASALFAFETAITVALGGLATAAIAYLQTQRLLRSGVAVVLAEGAAAQREVAGVGARARARWLVRTAVPVAGALTLAAFSLAADDETDELARRDDRAVRGGVSPSASWP